MRETLLSVSGFPSFGCSGRDVVVAGVVAAGEGQCESGAARSNWLPKAQDVYKGFPSFSDTG